jgi:serine/threonine protein kinase
VEPLKPNDPSHLGDWSITGRLGEGEDSVIYLGVRGVAGSEQAAIKLIEDDSFEFESALAKIKNEVEALKQLNNENIVKLLDANYEQGNLWIATEYIHGVTLDTKLKQTREPLEELHWFRIAENIFHALEAAHAKGIIHKDIKPSNIILSESGAKLIDFGISHVPDKTRTANPGDFEGSRLFSAPENYNRKNIEEMDVFSAGVTLAYAAKLKSVWAGDNQDAITESIKNDNPDLTGVTPLQEEFIRPLLEKLPIDRPNSASVHKKALEYIEYLVDKQHKNKPVALRVKKSLSRRLGNSWIKWGVPVGLVSALALAFTSPWSSKQAELVPDAIVTAAPSASSTAINSPTPTPQPIASQVASSSKIGPRNPNEVKCSTALEANLLDEAIKFCQLAAKEKDPRGTFTLGTLYVYKNDNANTEKYLKIAADLGFEMAFGGLGVFYEMTQKDNAKAELWYKKGVAAKIPENYITYALFLEKQKKFAEAEKYLILADKSGLTWGTYQLGLFYKKQGNNAKAEVYLSAAAKAGDVSAMFEYAELLRTVKDNLSSACDWYTKTTATTRNSSPTTIASAKSALIAYCQSGLTGAPVISDNVIKGTQDSRPYNSEALRWIIPRESINADYNYVQFKQVGGTADWKGISFAEKPSTNDKPWIEVFFSSAAKDLCIDFRLIKVEDSKVTKIWDLLPSNCYRFNGDVATKVNR